MRSFDWTRRPTLESGLAFGRCADILPMADSSCLSPKGNFGKYQLLLLFLFWAAAVTVGMALLLRYSFTPGQNGLAPPAWPQQTRLERDAERHTLVMVVHPRCSCTRASIGELAEVMVRIRDRARVYILFVKPPGVASSGGADGDNWEKTVLWTSASAIPNTNLRTVAAAV